MKVSAFILTLLKMAGDKLPRIIPHVLTIVAEVQTIVSIFNDGVAATPEDLAEAKLSKGAEEIEDILCEGGVKGPKALQIAQSIALSDEVIAG